MVAFILVHGTFASHASWIEAGSAIRQKLSAASSNCGRLAKFEIVKWSGKNRRADRVEASIKIADAIKRSVAAEPTAPIFLVGHSHGGSALAYFLKSFPDLRSNIDGCIFLSTPFIAMRLRPRASALATAIGTAFGIILFFLITALIGFFWWNCEWLARSAPGWIAVSLFICCTLLGSSAAIAVWTSATAHLRRSIEGVNFRDKISDTQTANLPNVSFLFVRASGDEAAALLSGSQFVSWCMNNLTDLASSLVINARGKFLQVTRSGWGRLLVAICAVILTVWLLTLVAIGLEFRSWNWSDFWGEGWTIGTGYPDIDSFFSYIVFLLFPFFTMLFGGAVAYSLVMLSSLSVCAVTLRLFGWMSIKEAIFTDFSVEPLPYGRHDLIHIDWNAQSSEEAGLSHSRTYVNPEALDQIAKFVTGALKRRGALGY